MPTRKGESGARGPATRPSHAVATESMIGVQNEGFIKPFTELLKRHSLVIGIGLMFLFTWPIDLANSNVLPFRVPFAVAITLGWGFIFASLIMTGLTLGKGAVITLLKRFLIWRVGWQWYLAAFVMYPAIFVGAVLLNAASFQAPIDFSTVMAHKIFGTSASLPLFIVPFFIFDALTNGEEMGWRGYVLPRLQAKHSALLASLILGAVWGFWHLPKYLAPGSTGSFAVGTMKVFADAILYTWLYNSTRGSLLLTTIFHAAGNTAGVFLPIANTTSGSNMGVLIIAIVIEILVAIVVTVVSGPERLSRTEPRQTQT
jgi:membrane protease YdiL (CAAX protease family)